jgi:hypothetical protein
MPSKVLDQLVINRYVCEGYVLVRELRILLETGYDHWNPAIKIKIWFGPDSSHMPYSFELSHHFHGPEQMGPYYPSLNSFDSEHEAINRAIHAVTSFMPSPESHPVFDEAWLAPNPNY